MTRLHLKVLLFIGMLLFGGIGIWHCVVMTESKPTGFSFVMIMMAIFCGIMAKSIKEY